MYPIPILFLIYKNPSATKRVFDEIKKIKPSKLYIAADGPKDSSEHKECSEVRLITENIDWNCEVYRRYLDDNMGCKVAVSSAITWLFDNEERGIILEYDCLPHKSFFTFCESMLVKYENNKSIMHISGSNLQDGINRGDGSYYFSALAGVWGWATWKGSWDLYESNSTEVKEFIESDMYKGAINNTKVRRYWSKRFLQVFDGINKSSWAIPWAFSVMKNKGLCVVPNVNLISNIGFNENATHATDKNSPFSCVKTKGIENFIEPISVTINHDADNYVMMKFYREEDSLFVILKINIKKYFFPFLPKLVRSKLLKFNQKFLR